MRAGPGSTAAQRAPGTRGATRGIRRSAGQSRARRWPCSGGRRSPDRSIRPARSGESDSASPAHSLEAADKKKKPSGPWFPAALPSRSSPSASMTGPKPYPAPRQTRRICRPSRRGLRYRAYTRRTPASRWRPASGSRPRRNCCGPLLANPARPPARAAESDLPVPALVLPSLPPRLPPLLLLLLFLLLYSSSPAVGGVGSAA